MVSSFQTKIILEDVIGHAFEAEDQEVVNRYKRFRLYFEKKDTTTVSGRYSYTDHKVYVYTKAETLKKAVRDSLHDVAHHIDWCNTKTVNAHQTSFYRAYTDLVYAVLDMKILTVEDFLTIQTPDMNIVNEKIVEMWRPHYVQYDPRKRLDEIDRKGSSSRKTSEVMSTPPAEAKAEIDKLIRALSDGESKEPSKQENSPQGESGASLTSEKTDRPDYTVIRVRNAYTRREELTELGYEWRWREKMWAKRVAAVNMEVEEQKLRNLGVTDYAVGKQEFSKEPKTLIVVSGKTYDYKESLRHHGFEYSRSNKGWYRKIPKSQVQAILAEMRDVPEFSDLSFAVKT